MSAERPRDVARAVFEDRRTALVLAVAGLAVFVAGMVVGGDLVPSGVLVTLAALVRIADQAASSRARSTYRYLRCRCGIDDQDGAS